MDVGWAGGGDGMNWEPGPDIYTTAMCKTTSGKLSQHRKLSSMLCDDLVGWDGGWREEDSGGRRCICAHMADPLCCMAGTNHCKAITPQL